MAHLYLVTHAHTQLDPAVNAARWQLSPTGQAQAVALAELPFWAKVDRILISSEAKTYLTVAPVLARRTIPVAADSRFDEVQRAGWVEDYADRVQAFFASPEQAVGGWEAAAHALRRFMAGLQTHLRPDADRSVALISHGLVLSLYRAHLLGLPAADFAAWRQLGFAAVARVDLRGPTLIADFKAAVDSPPRAV